MPIRRCNTWLSIACLLMVSFALLAGFWPFNFFPENQVRWIPGKDGIEFESSKDRKDCRGGGMVQTRSAVVAGEKNFSRSLGMTIELWLKPFKEPRRCRARILSFYDASDQEVFFVGQWRSHLMVRGKLRRMGGKVVFREIGVRDVLTPEIPIFVTICSGENGIGVYIDGKVARQYPNLRLVKNVAELSAFVARLGNNREGTGAWAGQLYGLAFYGRSLTAKQVETDFKTWTSGAGMQGLEVTQKALALYRFDERRGRMIRSAVPGRAAFHMPSRLPAEKKLLKASCPLNHEISDLLVNFLGFLPLGFLFCLRVLVMRSKRVSILESVVFAVAAGTLLSFCIEWGQVALPTRDSSLTDLMVNFLGTVAGAMLCAMETSSLKIFLENKC